MKTILVPVDFSPATHAVLIAAQHLGAAMGANLVLLHVVQPALVSSDYGLTIDLMREALAAARRTAAQQLAEVEHELSAQGITLTTQLLDGVPSTVIVELARHLGSDYIVLGSHGHTAFYELVVGSTSHSVLKNAPCPVLIVPPLPKHPTPPPAAR